MRSPGAGVCRSRQHMKEASCFCFKFCTVTGAGGLASHFSDSTEEPLWAAPVLSEPGNKHGAAFRLEQHLQCQLS